MTTATTSILALTLLLAGLMTAIPVPASAEQLNFDRTFTATPGATLTVQADAGNVTVTGTDADKVIVNIVATGSRRVLDQMTLDARTTNDGVSVTAKRSPARWFDWIWAGVGSDVAITVTVPRQYNLQLRTSGGTISVKRIVGTTNGSTSGGNIELDDLNGEVRMKTSGGDVDIVTVVGNVSMQTSGGDIGVRSIIGDFDGTTSGGDVRVDTITGLTRLHTSGGEIYARHVSGPVDATTSGGDVRLVQIDGSITAKTSGGDIIAELIGANRSINVASAGGEIVLQLPIGTTAALDAFSSSGKIRSELPVTSTSTGESRLNGTINGGGEKIYARTSGGDIVLQATRSTLPVEQTVERSE